MAAQEDKERTLPHAAPTSTDGRPAEGRDPDLYDPVGMAGKKAGIVNEIQADLKEEVKDAKPDSDKESNDPQIKYASSEVSSHGVPGFHNKIEPGDGVPLAGMELDVDTLPARVDTGTGDQPGNSKGSRFSTSGDAE